MGRYTEYSRDELLNTLHHYENVIGGKDGKETNLLFDLPLHQIELELQCRDLMETQHALEEARDRYADLYDFAPVGYLTLEAGGNIRNLNLTACAMLGGERESLLGLAFRSFLDGVCQRPFFALLQRAFQSGEPVSGEFELAADTARTVHLECQLHGEADGTQTCLTILTDVTDRKRAEAALEGEKAFLQHLIDGIGDPILVISPDYRVLRLNAAARRVAEASGLADDGCLTCHRVTHRSERPCDGVDHPCPLRTVLQTRRPTRVVHNHVSVDGNQRKYEVAVSPLFDEGGSVLGVIEVNRDISDHFELMQELEARDLKFEHLAQHDALTKLPNRVLFGDRLDQAVRGAARSGGMVAVLFVDLDRFKEINDSFDHGTGDDVLVEVAGRLAGLFRADDTVARMGGDEFTVILSQLQRAEDAAVVAHKMLALFDEPFMVGNRQLKLGASIGISVYPEHGRTVEELVRNADSAMYEAKAAGRMGFRYYSPELTRRAFERLALESALYEALNAEHFVVHYQPQIDLASGKVCGLEALTRWRSPDMGLVPPDKFITTAEETGLIVQLDRWVLRHACMQMKSWIDSGLLPAGLSISINISGRMFDSGELSETVTRVLAETGLDAANLELEVTESAMMHDVEQSAHQLRELRKQGIRVAIDDFGTGYSSLAYLKSLPLTRLKIDRMFVSESPGDGNAEGIARAIIALGKTLDLELLAEGIETTEQQEFLLRAGCSVGQGYLFCRALPAAELEAYLVDHGAR